jgi:hypothetical protein
VLHCPSSLDLAVPLCSYAEAFVKDAQAAGIPACVGVAVTDGTGKLLDSYSVHT